jgi:hypothetical protein
MMLLLEKRKRNQDRENSNRSIDKKTDPTIRRIIPKGHPSLTANKEKIGSMTATNMYRPEPDAPKSNTRHWKR